MRLYRSIVALGFVLLLAVPLASGQIVNRLKVDDATFQRYAYGRMQLYNPANLPLADSLYQEGVRQGDFRYKCLALSLEFPVRFSEGDYARMMDAVAEMKSLLEGQKDVENFYFSTLHEYCQYLIYIGRMSDAMLEARAMERRATEQRSPLGKMYSYRILGLIQSSRSNAYLAIANFKKAAQFCEEARARQDLPNLYILIAQEYVRLRQFPEAEDFCAQAEAFQTFFPSIGVKAQMTRAYLYYARAQKEAFWETYAHLLEDPLYKMQTEPDARTEMDVCYLRSRGLLEAALSAADSLEAPIQRHSLKHGIYADMARWGSAYAELDSLLIQKDSVYIKVQNEDLAILDAEMNNAQLREEAQRLKAQNQMTILIGFIVMFAVAFLAILFSQWQLRENLDTMKRKNAEMLLSRRAYQKALAAKEAENALKIKILQNRKSNTSFKL